MTAVTYRIVEHNGGWAYQLGSTYSETYPSHDTARSAAAGVAMAQKVPAEAAFIEYEAEPGQWVTERADGEELAPEFGQA